MDVLEMTELPGLAGHHSVESARYEVKYLINEAQAEQVFAWAEENLALDHHAAASPESTYRITSLYLDTAQRDAYHRRSPYRHSRYRLRRYGTERFVFLERKSKWGSRVKKRRTLLAEADLCLLESRDCPEKWLGSWFHRRILPLQLKPAYQVSYDRAAYVGSSLERPMRLTVDRRISCSRATGWAFAELGGLPVLSGNAIMELKYRGFLPPPFKSLIHALDMTSSSISKYRLAVRAWERIPVTTPSVAGNPDFGNCN
jgi:hypothetical protein